jgi:exodeoxyribonuclease-3
MKLATWNVNSLNVRLPQVLDWLAANPVDVLVLQETKQSDDKFPSAEIQAAGYQVHWFGQKTYNGVAILSRTEAIDIVRNIPGHADEQCRVITGTVDGIRVIGAYMPNGESPESAKFQYKMGWLQALRDWVRTELAIYPKLVLMGDYNIAPEDRDLYDPALAGTILATPQEREHFQQLLASGLVDSFRLFEQAPKLYSWWDYRNLAFRKNQGYRIDHILVSEGLRGAVEACAIDKLPRKNERPSDHAPVVLTLR